MKKFRVGVVGLGHRGRIMFKLAAEAFPEQVEPAAACDIIPANWNEPKYLMDRPMKDIFPQAVFYEDYETMLKEAGLDVILVETGADIHAKFCEEALRRNINVLSDIPVVATVDEANQLWQTAQKSKAMFCTGANANFTRYSLIMKHLYQHGFLGKPYCMEAEYIHWSLPGSRSSKALTENGDWRRLLSPIRYCTHSLGPLLALMEDDPLTKVSCFGTGPQADPAEYGKYKKDDMQCAQFQSDSGVVIRVMRNGRCRAQIGNHSYRIFGTEGYFERIATRGKTPDMIRYNSTRYYPASLLVEQSGDIAPFESMDDSKGGHGGCDRLMLDKFFQSLQNGTPPPVSLKEGLAMTIPGIYAEMSAKRGGELLQIKYPWN